MPTQRTEQEYEIADLAGSVSSYLRAVLDAQRDTGALGDPTLQKLELLERSQDLTGWEETLEEGMRDLYYLIERDRCARENEIFMELAARASKIGIDLSYYL